MSEATGIGARGSTPVTVVVGAVAIAAGAGALFGYLITGRASGSLWGALGIACFGGANAAVSVKRPSLSVAVGIGAAVGFAGGVCLLISLAPEQSLWVGGVAGAAMGVAEMLLWRWRR